MTRDADELARSDAPTGDVTEMANLAQANVFVQPVFGGTRVALSDADLTDVLTTEASGGDVVVRGAYAGGVLLPPVRYLPDPLDGEGFQPGHFFDRRAVTYRRACRARRPEAMDGLRAGAVLDLTDEFLLNAAVVSGGRVEPKVASSGSGPPTTHAVVEHTPDVSARYVRDLLGGRGLPAEAPAWATGVQQWASARVRTHLWRPDNTSGTLQWVERDASAEQWSLDWMTFGEGTNFTNPEVVEFAAGGNRPQKVGAVTRERISALAGIRFVYDAHDKHFPFELLFEQTREAGAMEQGVRMISGTFLANVAQLVFKPVGDLIFSPHDVGGTWQAGQLFGDLLRFTSDPTPDAWQQLVLSAADYLSREAGVKSVFFADTRVFYVAELPNVGPTLACLTPFRASCLPIERLPTPRQLTFKLPAFVQ